MSGHPFQFYHHETEKDFPASPPCLRYSICDCLWSEISHPAGKTFSLPERNDLKALQGAWRDPGPQFSQCPCCPFLYDGHPPGPLVSTILDPFLYCGCIYRMDSNLSGAALPYRYIGGSFIGLWGYKGFFLLSSEEGEGCSSIKEHPLKG